MPLRLNLRMPCSFYCICAPSLFSDWLPEAVSPSDKQTMSVSLLEICPLVTGNRAPNVCKMQELSAKTNYPFKGVTMSEEYDYTLRGGKHQNNIFSIPKNLVSFIQFIQYILRVILNYFTRWPWKQMGWWIVGGRNVQTPQLQHTRLQQWSITDVQHRQCAGTQTIRW